MRNSINVRGNCTPLAGSIAINGSKNATLPIMAASILSNQTITLRNVPYLSDVVTMSELLSYLGADVNFNYNQNSYGHSLTLNCQQVTRFSTPQQIVSKMRASCLVLGPLLARFKEAKIAFPGGCSIGARPIDMHLNALQKMGAQISIEGDFVKAEAPFGLNGSHISFDKVSVGATENTMMAATLAKGETIIENAATDPEVVDLTKFLIKIGAKIEGVGTKILIIQGVPNLDSHSNCSYQIIPDRLEAGTYAIAAIITNGTVELKGITEKDISCIVNYLRALGAQVIGTPKSVIVIGSDRIHSINITTGAYPDFPSDMQAQFVAALILANGQSVIEEKVFENRFMYASEFNKMGASIVRLGPDKILVTGVTKLFGSVVAATDLRAAAALLIAALVANGETIIQNIDHLHRGYERISEKLNYCGTSISKCPTDPIQ